MNIVRNYHLHTILVVDDSHHDYETHVRFLAKARANTYHTRLLSLGKHDLRSLAILGVLFDERLPPHDGICNFRREPPQGRYVVTTLAGAWRHSELHRRATVLLAQLFSGIPSGFTRGA